MLVVITVSSIQQVSAHEVSTGGFWYQIRINDVETTGCFFDGFDGCDVAGALSTGDPPWTFVCGIEGCELSVADHFNTSDQFEVFDNGVSIGTTSLPSPCCIPKCFTPNECFASPDHTKGTFHLGPGPHSINMFQIFPHSPDFTGGTRAFFKVLDLNEPPMIEDKQVVMKKDTPVTIMLEASDPEGRDIIFSIAYEPSAGTLGPITQHGPTSASVVYTPGEEFMFEDEFGVRVSDGEKEDFASIVVLSGQITFFNFDGNEVDGSLEMKAMVLENSDDDDNDGVVDSDDSDVPGEDDLIMMRIDWFWGGSVKLVLDENSGGINVWDSPTKDNLVDLSSPVEISESFHTFWIEGLFPTVDKDVVFSLDVTFEEMEFDDLAKGYLTVLGRECGDFTITAVGGTKTEVSPLDIFHFFTVEKGQNNVIPIKIETLPLGTCTPMELRANIEGGTLGDFDFRFFFESSSIDRTMPLDPDIDPADNFIIALEHDDPTGRIDFSITGKHILPDGSAGLEKKIKFTAVINDFDIVVGDHDRGEFGSDQVIANLWVRPDGQSQLFLIDPDGFILPQVNGITIELFSELQDIFEITIQDPPGLPSGFMTDLDGTSEVNECEPKKCTINFFTLGDDSDELQNTEIGFLATVDDSVPLGRYFFDVFAENQAGKQKDAEIVLDVIPNTLEGSGVSSKGSFPDEGVQEISVKFDRVHEVGQTTIDLNFDGPPPPSGFAIQNFAGKMFYFDINTNAVFSGPITITFDLSVAGVPQELRDQFKLMHFNEATSEWEDITIDRDASKGIMIGKVNGLSTFAIMVPSDTQSSILVGGNVILIDKTTLLLVGTQITASWLIPVIVAGIGIGFVLIKRKLFYN